MNKPAKRPRPAALMPETTVPNGKADRMSALAEAIEAVRAGKQISPRTAKLLGAGIPKMAQKVIEEAAEVAIDAVRGDRAAVINESVDLLYNLVVLWSALGLEPNEIWAEMDRREALLGMAEKLPKASEAEA